MIVVFTETGKLARLVSKYKPQVPIICVSQVEDVVAQMHLQRGVTSVHADFSLDLDQSISLALQHAKKSKLCIGGAKVVTITGTNEDSPDETNIMKIMNVE